ncbi:class I SAM-dependent methyltransferase [Neisseria chenwenguii]|uniref:Tellurium resistance protein TehB n=1 Tax=Neisseria chenwenguii TaxID=1853278 RepID=A0A220S4E1_9NEIS|nr:class I SAM-dependent methyltransferase [Neisseria chenwenguii]ASK28307.1 tellurium resistance protein TehB [Neisseria chenwenguii]ROV55468.1 class I SAM-dependent methyltransferase [Neisseria chenwenguii]
MNKWNERYAADSGFVFGTEPHEFIRRVAPYFPESGRALDLAAGEGRNGVFLAECGLQAEGTDLSAVGVGKARRLAAIKGVGFHAYVADVAEMAMPSETFSVITSVNCHFAEPVRSRLAQKIVAALVSDGLFAGVFFHPEQAALAKGPNDATMLADLPTLQTAFSGLEWLVAEHRREGVGDEAKSVICLLGRKV